MRCIVNSSYSIKFKLKWNDKKIRYDCLGHKLNFANMLCLHGIFVKYCIAIHCVTRVVTKTNAGDPLRKQRSGPKMETPIKNYKYIINIKKIIKSFATQAISQWKKKKFLDVGCFIKILQFTLADPYFLVSKNKNHKSYSLWQFKMK